MAGSPVDHAEAIYAVWHDPSTYDHLKMGPPYLPGAESWKARGRTKEASEAAHDSPQGVLLRFLPAYGPQPMAELAVLLAFLRATNSAHQAHHWQTHGTAFFGDHLLFERLYDETLKLVDQLAERAVGLGSAALVDPAVQAFQQFVILKGLCDGRLGPDPAECVLVSLKAVLQFLDLLRLVHGSLESRGDLTHGLDNLLQGIADKSEEFVYLLQQRAGGRTASM